MESVWETDEEVEQGREVLIDTERSTDLVIIPKASGMCWEHACFAHHSKIWSDYNVGTWNIFLENMLG
jgi:hypothetical protein